MSVKKIYDENEHKENQKKQLEEMANHIKNTAEAFEINPDHIAEYISFGSRFYKYSRKNVTLIYSQNKGATFVGSFAFFKKLGYSIKKGEHGIKIFVPVTCTLFRLNKNEEWVSISHATLEQKEKIKRGELETKSILSYKVGTVFDISQSTCPIEEYPQLFTMGNLNDNDSLYCSAIINFCKTVLQCEVKEEDFHSISIRGKYFPTNNSISLNENLKDTERLSTLTHEMGHAILHNDVNYCMNLTVAQKELEADAISLMIQSKLGIGLTELRKRHLSAHYKDFLLLTKNDKDKQSKIDDVLDHVFTVYTNVIEKLDIFINETLIENKSELCSNYITEKGKTDYLKMNVESIYQDLAGRFDSETLFIVMSKYILENNIDSVYIKKYAQEKIEAHENEIPLCSLNRNTGLFLYKKLIEENSVEQPSQKVQIHQKI